MRVLSQEQVEARLEKAYPGFERSVIGWDDQTDGMMRISAEDGLEDRNGDCIFDHYGSGDKYTMGVISHLYRWLQRNGWTHEWINNGELHLWESGKNGW